MAQRMKTNNTLTRKEKNACKKYLKYLMTWNRDVDAQSAHQDPRSTPPRSKKRKSRKRHRAVKSADGPAGLVSPACARTHKKKKARQASGEDARARTASVDQDGRASCADVSCRGTPASCTVSSPPVPRNVCVSCGAGDTAGTHASQETCNSQDLFITQRQCNPDPMWASPAPQAGPTEDKSTQTEGFFSSPSLSTHSSFQHKQHPGAAEEPLDLSVSHRSPVPESSPLTAPPHRLDAAQLKQTRLNESFFFKQKRYEDSPNAETRFMLRK